MPIPTPVWGRDPDLASGLSLALYDASYTKFTSRQMRDQGWVPNKAAYAAAAV